MRRVEKELESRSKCPATQIKLLENCNRFKFYNAYICIHMNSFQTLNICNLFFDNLSIYIINF